MQVGDLLFEAEQSLPYLSALRRHLHAHPEAGVDQPETVAYLDRQFRGMEVELRHGPGEVGLVVEIKGALPGPSLALRADMDALHLTESDSPDHLPQRLGFRSTVDGLMHACGHDAHCAILVGAGKLIYQHREELRGSVRLLFQPGEEGYGGAQRMVKAGYLEGIDEVYALHCLPTLKVGQVAYRKGPFCAAIDVFRVKVHGTGGHGSAPENSSDQVLALCKIVCDLQYIVARRVGALDQAVLSVCQVSAGDRAAKAVIPEVGDFCGSVRTFSTKVQRSIREMFFDVCHSSARAVHPQCRVEIEYEPECPAVVNDEAVVENLTSFLSRFVEPADLLHDYKPALSSEDFSYMLQEKPGAFMFLGVAGTDGDPSANPFLHSAHFDIDERALSFGARLFAGIVFGR
ncbi:M20 family metallopeptidase [Geomonas sp. RF6]|uniref:M20 metallopeptidase family protein n=1 Tax=Geomonas sp. RF6 TaxID=2897342 RepID=UPI001E386583|nr:M20 family metallopeptidase [Geomonas sp. RF6]UFS69576.1 M20 family metallopeptidase [Geomonas sp. RF6]